MSGHCVSCGCYRTSEEKARKHSDWFKSNPDEVKKGVLKRKALYEQHPEKLKNIGKKVADWYKNNPDKVREKAKKYSGWCLEHKEKLSRSAVARADYFKAHPEVIEHMIEKRNLFYKNHPEVLESAGKKIAEWYENNPDKVKEKGKRRTEWLKAHPEIIEGIATKTAEYHRDKKDKIDYSLLLAIIHPKHIDDLINRRLTSRSVIETRCPICGKYDKHLLSNVFVLKTASYRKRRSAECVPPVCCSCLKNRISSNYEQEIADYISTFYAGDLIRNDRKVLKGKELDLFYPEARIAIEFNGDYWHSDIYI